MTINYKLGEVPCILNYSLQNATVQMSVDWVSDGTYAMHFPNSDDKSVFTLIYISLEGTFFDPIIAGFEIASPVPIKYEDAFCPFWQDIILPRGMMLGADKVSAYRYNEWLILHSQTEIGGRIHILTEIVLKIDDFKKIRDIALESKEDKLIHYTQW